MRSHRALTGSVLLAVLVVAAAGITGTTHFAGARWLPHWVLSWHTPAPRKRPSVASTPPPRTSLPNRPGSFIVPVPLRGQHPHPSFARGAGGVCHSSVCS